MEHQFLVSARKYRPDTFDTVVGQNTITRTLKNAIKNKQLAHAYLFCGPRGVGKTTCARIFAKTINCYNPTAETEPCHQCESCKTFQEGRSYNIHELDAASNNHVDDIRNLIELVRIPPQVGKYSVYIIDEVHMLSQSAFNAFLKTLEEPPAHAIFILATTEKHKIIPTILSRCQIFDFQRIQIRDMIDQLKNISDHEQVSAELAALNIIAQKADGSMRDALSIYDQVVSFSGSNITYQQVIDHLNVLDYDYYFKLTEAFLSGDFGLALLVFDEILRKGFDPLNFITGLGSHFRNLLVSKDPVTLELFEMSGEIAARYQQVAAKAPVDFLLASLRIISQTEVAYRQSREPRLTVEVALINLCEPYRKDQPLAKEPGPQEEAPKEKITEAPKTSIGEKTTTEVVTETKAGYNAPPLPVAGTRISDFIKKSNAKEEPGSDVNSGKAVNENLVNTAAADPKGLTAESLRTYWLEFSELQKDQTRLYHMLTTQLPDLSGEKKITIPLLNPLQEKAIRTVYHEILNYLSRKTGVDDLEIEMKLNGDQETRKIYTQEEKYQYMREKNPDLDLFRQSLNLDFE